MSEPNVTAVQPIAVESFQSGGGGLTSWPTGSILSRATLLAWLKSYSHYTPQPRKDCISLAASAQIFVCGCNKPGDMQGQGQLQLCVYCLCLLSQKKKDEIQENAILAQLLGLLSPSYEKVLL